MSLSATSFDHHQSALKRTSIRAADYPQSIKDAPVDINGIFKNWLASFNRALIRKDHDLFRDLFFNESYWRDQLALGWDYRTLHGLQEIIHFLDHHPQGLRLQQSTIDDGQQPSLEDFDYNGEVRGIVAFFNIRTDIGTGKGVVRLLQDAKDCSWKAFTLFTVLLELTDFAETIRHKRPSGILEDYVPRKETLLAKRSIQDDKTPAVLVVGAGQAGISICARLQMLKVSCLIIDREARVGDNWRSRYARLTLHDPVWYNHLPYLPFPETWPVFTSKDKLADWLESYACTMDLNIWTSSTVESANWDGKRWTVTVRRISKDDTEQVNILHPRHIIQATGQAGEAHVPTIEGTGSFEGLIRHSSDFQGATPLRPDQSRPFRVIIVGSCSSAHDIAQDFYENGYHVTMIQRSTTCVDPTNYIDGKGLYKEDGPPLEMADLLTNSLPSAVMKRIQIDATTHIELQHHDFFRRLKAAGLKLDQGPDGAGRKLKYLESGGGYYIDMGASRLIIEGHIKVRSGVSVSQICPQSVILTDGTSLAADEIIFATGFQSMRTTTRKIFGDKVANQVSEVWGLEKDGELRSVWRRSGHPGFWFAAGNLALSRYYSKLLALQIKGVEEGLMQYDDW